MRPPILYLVTFILLFSASGNLLAESIANSPKVSDQLNIIEPPPKGVFGSVIGKLEQTHYSISSGLERSAESVDNFFADDKVFEQTNESYLRLALDMVYKEYSGTGFVGDLKLKVELPRTKKRLKLLIETDSQRDEKDNLEDLPTDVVQERDFFISLEREVRGKQNWNTRPSLGIKVHTPLDTFARLRSHRNFSLNKWLLRVSDNLSWFDSRGFEANGSLEFDRAISSNLLFRSSTTLRWKEEELFRRFDQGVSLFHQIDHNQSLAYQIAGSASDEFEWLARQYYLRARYRKGLYKKWMFGEIIPQWDFFKEKGFHSEPSITFRLEIVFGENYK